MLTFQTVSLKRRSNGAGLNLDFGLEVKIGISSPYLEVGKSFYEICIRQNHDDLSRERGVTQSDAPFNIQSQNFAA